MKAAVLTQFCEPLRVEDVPLPRPEAGEVVVKLEAAGVCHTDLHIAQGHWRWRPALPRILGHEGVGIVSDVGAGVTLVKEGDRVAVPWINSACGHCEYCVSGREELCPAQRNTGLGIDGCYAESVRVDARFVAPVTEGLDPREVAPLVCAGLTAYKSVQVAGTHPSDLVAIFGVGGTGHLAIQYARLTGATVIAVDVTDTKLELAKDLGAEHVINPLREEPADVIRRLGGADQALVFAGRGEAFGSAFRSVRRGGRVVLVARLAPADAPLPLFETVQDEISVFGAVSGNRMQLAEVLELHRRGRTRVVYETRRLEQVNEVFSQLEKKEAAPKTVLLP